MDGTEPKHISESGNAAFATHGARPGQGASRWVLTCDHASNAVPDWVNGGNLGISEADMNRHIAYDVGAAGVTQALCDLLDGHAVLGTFSRLVIDPNRGDDDPTLIMQIYDGTVIPANRHLDQEMRQSRLDRLYRPYHEQVSTALSATANPLIVSVHSFTPQLQGKPPRPWHVGILSAADRRLADPVIELLSQEPDICVGDNEPYKGALIGDAMDQHGLQRGIAHILIELRSDLIETPKDQISWAKRLHPILVQAAQAANL